MSIADKAIAVPLPIVYHYDWRSIVSEERPYPEKMPHWHLFREDCKYEFNHEDGDGVLLLFSAITYAN